MIATSVPIAISVMHQTLGQHIATDRGRLGAQCVGPGDEVVDLAAERLRARVAEQRLGCWIPRGHDVLEVGRDDRNRADLEERLDVVLLPWDRNRERPARPTNRADPPIGATYQSKPPREMGNRDTMREARSCGPLSSLLLAWPPSP